MHETEPELSESPKNTQWPIIALFSLAILAIAATLVSRFYYGLFNTTALIVLCLALLLLMITLVVMLLRRKASTRRVQERYSELEQKLYEKDILLKEVHHRVKNNLQTVCSLLNMQSRGTEDKQMKSLISSSQNRVMAMSMVHEMLYLRDDLSTIDYKPYVFKLTEYLVKSVKGPDSQVKLAIDIPDIELGIDTAIPLGLLINETITNSLKYGIQDDAEGEIHIELKKEDENGYVLTIGDNGIGISETVDPKTTKSLGLKLIYNLARQLKGSITRDWSRKGTNYIVKFKDIGHEPFHNMA
jgi:two-component sensor histidine kinase